MITYAIRETPKGYLLTELSIYTAFNGERRKQSHDTLYAIYKRKEFAEKKAHEFYRRVYGNAKPSELVYAGVIKQNDYSGEVA